MADSKFWRTIAAVACIGLFYVGTAFRGGNSSAPSLTSTAFAGGAGTWVRQLHPNNGIIYTSNADGTKLYVWFADGDARSPSYYKTITINGATP